jgi:hypothetical protein
MCAQTHRRLLLLILGLVGIHAPICLGETASTADVPFEILRSGYKPEASIQESMLLLARDETEFRHIWTELTERAGLVSSEGVPKVDFGQSMVVAFLGALGDNCDPYRLVRVIARPDKLTLKINHRVPGNACTCASFVSEPYILIRIGRTTKPIDFLIESETHDCG